MNWFEILGALFPFLMILVGVAAGYSAIYVLMLFFGWLEKREKKRNGRI